MLGGLNHVVGFGLAISSLVFVSRGQKLPAEQGQPQRTKFNEWEITTDRIGLLVIVGAVAMVLPIDSTISSCQ